jgi:hypothetical protein
MLLDFLTEVVPYSLIDADDTPQLHRKTHTFIAPHFSFKTGTISDFVL